MEATQKILKSIPAFSKLKDKELLFLKNISHIKILKNNEILFYEGEEGVKLHIVLKGIIEVFKTDTKGKEIVLKQFAPYSFVAEVSNYAHINFPASSKSIGDSLVLIIDYKKFEEKILYCSNVAPFILKSIVDKVMYLEKIISDNLIMNATQRVAKFIYENDNCLSTNKHHEIANILNITPVTLSRILRKFKKNQIISSDDHILDKDLLKKEFILE